MFSHYIFGKCSVTITTRSLCMSRVIFVYLSRSAAFIFNIAANKSTLTIGFGNALQSTWPRSSAAFNFATVDVAHSGCVLARGGVGGHFLSKGGLGHVRGVVNYYVCVQGGKRKRETQQKQMASARDPKDDVFSGRTAASPGCSRGLSRSPAGRGARRAGGIRRTGPTGAPRASWSAGADRASSLCGRQKMNRS